METREVPSGVPSAVGVQSQTLVNPSIGTDGSTLQYVTAGSYQTVASQTVTVSATNSGLFQLSFQAQAYSGVSNIVGVRYLIDSQIDPNDAVIRAGTANDVVESIGTSGWQTLYLTRLLTLSPGTHTIAIQVACTNDGFTLSDELAICSSTLSVVGFNTVTGTPVATGTQTQAVASPASGSSAQQDITDGGYQTVAAATVTVGPTMTGQYDLTFQAQAYASVSNLVSVRYVIDGHADSSDMAMGSNGTGADTSEEFADGSGGGQWHTLLLMHELTLTGGTHTISVQVMCATPSGGTNLVVYTPVLSLIGYSVVDGVRGGAGQQVQALTAPDPNAPGQQDITAGSFQTVASTSVNVAGNRTGLYNFVFQAQAAASSANRVYVRYLIDGQPDPNDLAITQSSSSADATEDFFDNFGANALHTLFVTRLLTLTPGTHTVSVQVYCTEPSETDGPDLVVYTPALHVTGYNNITAATGGGTGSSGGSGFSYDPTTQVLTINGTGRNDVFALAQATVANADGTLTTTYTCTLDGVSQSYTSDQVSRIVVNGNGGSDIARIFANNTYIGLDGLTHAIVEQASLGAGGGTLQALNATGAFVPFLQLNNISNIYATMGHADSALVYAAPGNATFVSKGLTATLSGTGYLDQVTGAGAITAYSNTGHDVAYQYDGSGASTFTAMGATSSTMTGTDQGQSFTDTAVGFKLVRHRAARRRHCQPVRFGRRRRVRGNGHAQLPVQRHRAGRVHDVRPRRGLRPRLRLLDVRRHGPGVQRSAAFQHRHRLPRCRPGVEGRADLAVPTRRLSLRLPGVAAIPTACGLWPSASNGVLEAQLLVLPLAGRQDQWRLAVRTEMPSASAVSAMVRPTK